jgi:hypothetical protein
MEERKQADMHVLWWGATEAEYAWLKERVAAYRSSLTTPVKLRTIDEPIEQISQYIEAGNVDRLIVACRNRWDYPQVQLQQLASGFPDVPIALAVGDWWLGWRRTGIGHLQMLPHLSLPWYRWWDGWVYWLEGSLPTMFGPFPLERATIGIRSSDSLIKSGQQPNHQSPVDWLVWDDSRLATWLGWEKSLNQAIAELQEIQTSYPLAKLWIAWTLPTWELVSRLNQAGLRFELLAKPHLSSLSSAALART